MKTLSFIALLILSLPLSEASNSPLFTATYSNMLQINNPAYYGLGLMAKSPFQSTEFSIHSYYSKNFDYYSKTNFPVFNNSGVNGCIGYDKSCFKTNANAQNFNFNSRTNLGKKLQIGYGMSLNLYNMDLYSNGTGTDIGFSIISPNSRGGHFSFGANFKYDRYNYKFTTLDGNIEAHDEDIHNFDLGFAYLSKNNKFSFGLSLFNLKERYVGKITETPGGWGSSYSYFALDYNSTCLINFNKISRLNKAGDLNLASNIQATYFKENGYNYFYGDMLLHTNIRKTIKGNYTIGLGMALNSLYYDALYGPNFYFSSRSFECHYSLINTGYNIFFSGSGLHSLTVKLSRF